MNEEEHVDRYGWGLEVHHRKKARKFDDLEAANRLANLQTVCRQCHREVERGTGTDE
jgi:predicted HNH restriction endonuclease